MIKERIDKNEKKIKIIFIKNKKNEIDFNYIKQFHKLLIVWLA